MGQWINKLGVEVECGIKPDLSNEERDIPGFDITHDGSLTRSPGTSTNLKEYVSEAHKYPDQMQDLKLSIEDLYEIINDINESMGLHIHVSFNKDEYYYRIASKKFHDYFIEELKETEMWENNHSLRKRVEGGSNNVRSGRDCQHYCKPLKTKDIDNQLNRRGSGLKYRRIVYYKHKYDTVEFRLFPAMETAEEVIDAIEFTTERINHFMQNKLYAEKAELEAYKNEDEEETVENLGEEKKIEAGEVIYNV